MTLLNDEFTTRKEARAMARYQLLRVLRALMGFLETLGAAECKTVGNMNPEGLHCFACTFADLQERVRRAVDFWEKDDRYKEASS